MPDDIEQSARAVDGDAAGQPFVAAVKVSEWSGRSKRRTAEITDELTDELTAEHARRSVEQISTDFDGHRWFTAPEAVAYDLAGEVIDDPVGAPEPGTPA
jgi:Clp protease